MKERRGRSREEHQLPRKNHGVVNEWEEGMIWEETQEEVSGAELKKIQGYEGQKESRRSGYGLWPQVSRKVTRGHSRRRPCL